MTLRLSPLLLLWACSGTEPPPSDDPTGPVWWTQDPTNPTNPTDPTNTDPTNTNPGPTGTLTGDYNGSIPTDPLPPPTFTALNRDGTQRTQADLIGQPTALWFYPAAFTGG